MMQGIPSTNRALLPFLAAVALTLALAVLACQTYALADNSAKGQLNLIPWPKSLRLADGNLKLSDKTQIVASSDDLKPLAQILSDELYMVTGLKLATAAGNGQPGDIVLRINPGLQADADILTVRNQKVLRTRDYAHTIAVSDKAVVEGFDYRAVAEGTATLLQVIRKDGGALLLPKMTVKDWPEADFMAVMVDVGRQYIPLDALRQTVEACRVYKVRYLMLHLTDDQGWTFPSKAFPKLGSRNTAAHGGIPPKVYGLQALKDFVAFADARGVTIVPEFESAGHSGAARLAMPETFDAPKTPGGEAWIAVMNLANDNMYPAMETIVNEMCNVFKSSPYFHIGCDECRFGILEELPSTKEYLQRHNMKGVGELFTQHIKRMNEFVKKNGKKTIAWEGAAVDASLKDEVIMLTWEGNSRAAEQFQKMGFTTITCPWGLGVPWEQWSMYICNGSFLDKKKDKVIGALLPMWEMGAEGLISDYLKGIPGRQERTWGPDNLFTEAELKKRTEATEALVTKLILPVAFKVDGVDKPKDPATWGLPTFYTKLTVTMAGPDLPGTIHYTLDENTPTAQSPAYDKPIELKKSTTLKAAFFDKDGKMLGHVRQASWRYVSTEKNLTTGKPVTASSSQAKEYAPENAVDGAVQLDKGWWAAPAPQWLQVDLQKAYKLDRVCVFPYWDGNRYYQYTVELSVDGKTWTQVVDMSKNTQPSTEDGHESKFPAQQARYVRVNMLKGSANEAVHLVELRAYETP